MENGIDDSPGLVDVAAPPVLDTGKRLLPCTLTTPERLAAAERLALLIEQRDDLAVELREFGSITKDRLKRIEGEIAQVAMRLRTGTEDRIIAVTTVANALTDTADTLREDTGDLVASRPLTDQDRQQAFNFRDPEPDPEAEAGAPA